MGQIDQTLYKKHIYPYLTKIIKIDLSFDELVKCFQFLVHSECKDTELMQKILNLLAKKMKNQTLNDALKNKVHLFLHYLEIKGIKVEISQFLAKEFDECCRRYEGNGKIARMMVIELDEKGRQDGKDYVTSECLRRNRIGIPQKQDKG